MKQTHNVEKFSVISKRQFSLTFFTRALINFSIRLSYLLKMSLWKFCWHLLFVVLALVILASWKQGEIVSFRLRLNWFVLVCLWFLIHQYLTPSNSGGNLIVLFTFWQWRQQLLSSPVTLQVKHVFADEVFRWMIFLAFSATITEPWSGKLNGSPWNPDRIVQA